jgi:DNA-directed RNA polymerase subunit beta
MAEFVPVGRKRQRLTFGRARDLVEIPDMIEVQRNSYDWFYQKDCDPDSRKLQGLEELLHEVFPIESYDGAFALEFVHFFVDNPSGDEEEARQRDLTWSQPIRATIRLVNRKTKEIKEEEIFLGDFPDILKKYH